MFFIELKKYFWIDDSLDNLDDLCLHGDVVVNIGSEHFDASCTISATALYLLRTITENHIFNEDNQMLPCCGHFYIPNDKIDTVQISGCPNGIDWSVIHVGDNVEISTEQGTKVVVDINSYIDVVHAFAKKVQSIYDTCSSKNVPKDDFYRKGYVAFWNEFTRRFKSSSDVFFCPAVSNNIDIGLCWEYCFVDIGAPSDTAGKLKQWISKTNIYNDIEDFHTICEICSHCQWSK